MDYKLLVTTLVGAFTFPFMIQMAWGRMVKEWGAAGGFVAALFIVGTTWALNHGFGLMHQSGNAWVDMGLAAGVGCFVATATNGGSVKKGLKPVLYALVGGLLAGLVVSLIW